MYKRSWNKKYGKSEIFTREDSYCQKVEMDMLRLADGDKKSYREIDKEYALVILGGKCTVEAKDFKYENIGERETGASAKYDEFYKKELDEKLKKEKIDVTLSGKYVQMGHVHPITETINEITDIFHSLGFSVAPDKNSPEVETEYYHFDGFKVDVFGYDKETETYDYSVETKYSSKCRKAKAYYKAPDKKLNSYQIDPAACIKCGACIATCKFKAIVQK